MKGKKTITALALTLMCGLTGGLMVGCSSNQPAQYKFASSEELYAFSAVSGVELALSTASCYQMFSLTNGEFENMVDDIHSYFPVFEGFLGGKKLMTPQQQASDNVSFSHMLTTEYTDVIGNSHNYKIYYNEDSVIQDNDDDREIVANIIGKIYLGEEIFSFTGVKEIEHDEQEIEFTVNIDESTSIVINQELENDEQEFVYTLFYQGLEIYSTSVGFEIENGRIEYSAEYEDSDGKELELEFYQSKKNPNLFYVEYEDEKKEVKIKVVKVTENGTTSYVYTCGDLKVTKVVA